MDHKFKQALNCPFNFIIFLFVLSIKCIPSRPYHADMLPQGSEREGGTIYSKRLWDVLFLAVGIFSIPGQK